MRSPKSATPSRRTFFVSIRSRRTAGTDPELSSSRKLNLTDDEIARPFAGATVEQFPVILSPDQLAELLGLSGKTIYEWMSRGRLDGTYRKRGEHALIWRDRAPDALFNGKEWSG